MEPLLKPVMLINDPPFFFFFFLQNVITSLKWALVQACTDG